MIRRMANLTSCKDMKAVAYTTLPCKSTPTTLAELALPVSSAACQRMREATHCKQSSSDGLRVLVARDALHQDVADVPQDGARGKQHQCSKDKGADGIRN